MGQSVKQLVDDLPSTLIALAVVVGDVVLHLANKTAGPLDTAVSVVVTAVVVGRIARNGKTPKPE